MQQTKLCIWVVVVLLTLPFTVNVSAESTSYDTANGTVIEAGSELVVDLGTIPAGWWVFVTHDSDDVPIDITIMTRSNWDSYNSQPPSQTGRNCPPPSVHSSGRWMKQTIMSLFTTIQTGLQVVQRACCRHARQRIRRRWSKCVSDRLLAI